jgi:3-oxoacyl-[acyl-carrier protein] reductase
MGAGQPDQTRPVAVVSGGSRGIGRSVVLRLAEAGYDVSFCYRKDSDAAAEVLAGIVAVGGQGLARQVNVTDPGEVRQWLAETESTLAPFELVVTSAGILHDIPLVMMSDEQWHDVIGVNLDGTFHLCRAAAFAMVKHRRGCIVNLSSVAGIYGNTAQCNYSAAKAGVIGFSKALAKEVGRYGIRVNAVAPGYIETDMVAGLADSIRSQALSKITLGRFGEPTEVADAVLYLAGARYVTGSVLQIDGGIAL